MLIAVALVVIPVIHSLIMPESPVCSRVQPSYMTNMPSVERQLLGTETVKAMRSRCVKSRICGLFANDMADTFLSNGADDFLMKPFSTEQDKS